MGKRGPRPTPTPVLRARGSRRADRRPPGIQAPPGRPDPPAWLNPAGRAVWDQLVPILEEMGVLTRADPLALGRYCRLHIRWLQEEDFLDRYGSSYPLKDGNGRVKCFMPFPQVATAAKLAALLIKMEQEFGLTPSARSRVEVDRRFIRAVREPTEFERMFLMPRPLTPAEPVVPWSPGDQKIERQRREHRETIGGEHGEDEQG